MLTSECSLNLFIPSCASCRKAFPGVIHIEKRILFLERLFGKISFATNVKAPRPSAETILFPAEFVRMFFWISYNQPAVEFAARGYRVLEVDMDSQGNLRNRLEKMVIF